MSQPYNQSIRASTKFVTHPICSFKIPKYLSSKCTSPQFIRFQIMAYPEVIIQVDFNQMILLGRSSPIGEEEKFSRLDLTELDARRKGVSRDHAAIFVRDGKMMIRDLKSSNGTYLNDEELYSLRDYPLHDADRIKLGKLAIAVIFDY